MPFHLPLGTLPGRLLLQMGAAAVLLANMGCASLLAGGDTPFYLEVEHPPAKVSTRVIPVSTAESRTIEGSHFRLALDRRTDYLMRVEAAGHEAREIVIRRQFHPAVLLDVAVIVGPIVLFAIVPATGYLDAKIAALAAVLLGLPIGLAGLGVDYYTGAMWRHDKTEAVFRLDAPQ